jgi:hypothetical protein
MYYQVSYTDKNNGRRIRSSIIHTSNDAGLKEMRQKMNAGHKNVILGSGSKLKVDRK